MAKISKQDLTAPRTAADIERKYNFGKSFAEIAGIATDARITAEKAEKAVENLDNELTQEEIFNRLTNNGQSQGLFRDESGQLYINAEYINFDELNGKSLTLTGKFTCNTEGYFVPGDEEIQTAQHHILGNLTIPDELLPIYDFNADGVLDSRDCRRAKRMQLGLNRMEDWPNAKKTPVKIEIDMSNPEKAIRMSGTNMWGREVSGYIGINGTNIPLAGLADYVVEEGETSGWQYRMWNSGKVECYCSVEAEHPAGANTEFTGTINLPFTIKDPKVFLQGADYCWNLRKPLYFGKTSDSLTIYFYPDTDMSGYRYVVNVQVVGEWK